MEKHDKHDIEKIGLLVIVWLNLIFTLYLAFFKTDALALETLKSGGRDNFKLVEKLYNSDAYKTQQKQSLEQVLSSLNTAGTEADTTANAATDTNTDANWSTLDQSTISKLLDGAYYHGKKDAKIVILEYSDLLCPYCKRHYSDQTIETVVKNDSNVALVFKNMPLEQLHPTAPKGAQGLYCAGKLGGEDKYYSYLAEAFKAEEFTDTSVVELAKNIGLDATKFTACYNDSATKAAVNASISEWNWTFGINGTPGNVVLNRETGKYIVINGAYPVSKFEEAVKTLLK